jgi:hypothetical protein
VDSVTILTGNKLAAKVIRGNAKPEVVLPATWFRWDVVPIASLADFHDLLARVTASRHALIIRDRPKASLVPSRTVRRIKENFDPIDHHWVMLDFDGIESPPGQRPVDLLTVDWLIKRQLPPAFHHADYIGHFSSSAGTSYAGNKIKVHVLFWLAQPANSRDLRDWADSVGADPGLFHAVQPHFVADPIFEGCTDPLNGVRLFHVQKGQPEVAFVPPPVVAVPHVTRHRSNRGGPVGIVRDAAGLIVDGREVWLRDRLYSILARRVGGSESIAFADIEAEAWNDFQAECDLTGWSQAAVAGKVHATLERHRQGAFPALRRGARAGMAPHYTLQPTPIADIRAALARAGNDFFNQAAPGDVVVLAAPPGSGKSTMVQRELRDGEGTCDYYAPTLALAGDVAHAIGPDARVIRGRGQPDPARPGAMMCDRYVVAAEVSKAGLSVSSNLCRGCPFRASCGYLAQWQDAPRVRIMAHAYLGLTRPGSVRRADYIVIDEAFIGVASIQGRFSISDLLKISSFSLQNAIRDGLENGRLLETLDAAGITPDVIRAAQRGIFKDQKPDIKGAMPDAEITAKLGKRRAPSRLAGFLGWLAHEFEAMKPIDVATETAAHMFLMSWLGVWWLAREINHPWWYPNWGVHFLHKLFCETPLQRGVSHVAWLHDCEVYVSYPRKLHRLEGQPILHIDGTANQEIVERLLGPCDFRQWDAIRHATIYQVTDRANGKSRLSENPEWLDRVARFGGRLVGKTFLCLQKEPRRTLTGETGDKLPVPSEVHPSGLDIFHYGQTTGLNGFEDHDNALIVGRMEPPPHAIEAFRGLFWNDPDPLLLTGEYVYQDQGYPSANGRGVTVQIHPEPRLQVYLEQAREAGVVQAVDRLRLCDPSDRPRRVFIFTNLPIRLAPDHLVSESDLIPEWVDIADLAGGVLIDSPKALAAALPERFKNIQAAKDWFRRAGALVPWCGAYPKVAILSNDSFSGLPPLGSRFALKAPLAALSYRAGRPRSNRPLALQRAITLLNPLTALVTLRKRAMKSIEAAYNLGGIVILGRDATPAEVSSAHHAAARLIVHEADPDASARRNEAEAVKALAVLILEGGSLATIPRQDRAVALRDISEAPPAERVGLLADILAHLQAAQANPGNLPPERLAPWLGWAPLTQSEIEQIAFECKTEAESLLEMIAA